MLRLRAEWVRRWSEGVAPFKEVDIPLHSSSARATPTDREKTLRHPKRKLGAESEAELHVAHRWCL